jgi:hypothetical protein
VRRCVSPVGSRLPIIEVPPPRQPGGGAKEERMSEDANKATARRYFEESWNRHDVAVFEALFDLQSVHHPQTTAQHTRPGWPGSRSASARPSVHSRLPLRRRGRDRRGRPGGGALRGTRHAHRRLPGRGPDRQAVRLPGRRDAPVRRRPDHRALKQPRHAGLLPAARPHAPAARPVATTVGTELAQRGIHRTTAGTPPPARVSARWGGQPGMPPRRAGAWAGAALTAGSAVVLGHLACLAG